MPCKVPGDSFQLGKDPDVNRTMNLVGVLTLMRMLKIYVSVNWEIDSILSGVKIIR